MNKIIVFVLCAMLAQVTVVQAGVPGFMKARMGTLEGTFYGNDGSPHAKGIVSFFNVTGGPPPIMGSVRRVPDMVTRTDDKGHFGAKLLPGTYYMGALVRDEKGGPGPPREGEKYFFAMDDAGVLGVFEVKKRAKTEAGKIIGATPDHFKEFQNFVTLKGDVRDEKGQPVAGILVTVKKKLNAPRPMFISDKTKEDGSYQMRLPPGRYYIQARESLRAGRPRTGSYIGTYGKTPPETVNRSNDGGNGAPGARTQGGEGEAIAIDAAPGQTYDGLSIHMFKIPDPDETRKKYEMEARKRKKEAEE